MSYEEVVTAKCSKCGTEYKIGLKQHIMPYNDTERAICPCGNTVSYKSRWIEVDFIFDGKERS